jgi:hypothetical protein
MLLADMGSSAGIMDQPSLGLPTQTKPLWIVRRTRPRTRAMMPTRHVKTLLPTMLPWTRCRMPRMTQAVTGVAAIWILESRAAVSTKRE